MIGFIVVLAILGFAIWLMAGGRGASIFAMAAPALGFLAVMAAITLVLWASVITLVTYY